MEERKRKINWSIIILPVVTIVVFIMWCLKVYNIRFIFSAVHGFFTGEVKLTLEDFPAMLNLLATVIIYYLVIKLTNQNNQIQNEMKNMQESEFLRDKTEKQIENYNKLVKHKHVAENFYNGLEVLTIYELNDIGDHKNHYVYSVAKEIENVYNTKILNVEMQLMENINIKEKEDYYALRADVLSSYTRITKDIMSLINFRINVIERELPKANYASLMNDQNPIVNNAINHLEDLLVDLVESVEKLVPSVYELIKILDEEIQKSENFFLGGFYFDE